jgi:hypothetical protein
MTAAYAANPVPTLTGPVHPQAVAPGRGNFTVAVYGANFVDGAVVNWNGGQRSTTFLSARELQATILAADVAKPTAGYITVPNPAPGGGPSSSSYAIVEVHQPDFNHRSWPTAMVPTPRSDRVSNPSTVAQGRHTRPARRGGKREGLFVHG